MELGAAWAEMGLVGLFLAAFLAATVLPFSSEVVLLAMATAGWEPLPLLAAASLGNWSGGMSSYALGWWGNTQVMARWTGVQRAAVDRWQERSRRYGAWLALLCWAPVVGDVIALALGLFRVRVAAVAALMFIGKALRYAVLLAPWWL